MLSTPSDDLNNVIQETWDTVQKRLVDAVVVKQSSNSSRTSMFRRAAKPKKYTVEKKKKFMLYNNLRTISRGFSQDYNRLL